MQAFSQDSATIYCLEDIVSITAEEYRGGYCTARCVSLRPFFHFSTLGRRNQLLKFKVERDVLVVMGSKPL